MRIGKLSLRLIRRTRGVAALIFSLSIACSIVGAQSSPSPEPLELLKQLNSVALDATRVFAIRDAHLKRGGLDLYLNRGFIAFMTPVLGEVTGAVFWGDGEVLTVPPNQAEKRSLAQFTHAPILDEKIKSVYLRFTDRTAEDLLASTHRPDPDDPEQPGSVVEEWSASAQALNGETSVRILTDLLGDRNHPYFYARVNGEELGAFLVTQDERLPEPFAIASLRKVGPRTFTDVWCSFATLTEKSELSAPLDSPVAALAYKLNTHIYPNHGLEGRAEIQLQSRSAQDRVLSFDLSRWLTVTSVQDDQGRSIALIGGDVPGADPALPRESDRVTVVLPHPYPKGANYRLVFQYRGNVITDVGNGVLYVGARGTWYPNIDAGLPSQYDMTFHYPRKQVLVATGERREEKTSGQETESHWRSDGVFRVAGFNLGPYTSVERNAGKALISVYATREAESSLAARHDTEREPPLVQGNPRLPAVNPIQAVTLPLAPSAMLGDVADVAAQAVRYYSNLFGPYPYPRLAIAQAPGTFGQGWPELVYLPTLSFLPKTERTQMGLERAGYDPMGPQIIAHEIAHQWWGNLLDWRTYHDQWLSEGLASYAAALFLAQGKDGDRQFHELLRDYKHDLLAKTGSGATIESGGPIWLGQRLSNSMNPDGYSNIVYKKACWVLNMLRAVMSDPQTDSDARFFRMLRDFVSAYQGRSISTEDFLRHAEKYTTADIDLEHNRKLDWFFKEWVYDTGIPEYTLKTDVGALTAGRYEVRGTISQKGVSAAFEMPVRITAVYAGNRRLTLGQVVVGDSGGQFKFVAPRKPLRVTIDEDSLLAVVH